MLDFHPFCDIKDVQEFNFDTFEAAVFHLQLLLAFKTSWKTVPSHRLCWINPSHIPYMVIVSHVTLLKALIRQLGSQVAV